MPHGIAVPFAAALLTQVGGEVLVPTEHLVSFLDCSESKVDGSARRVVTRPA